MDYAIRVLLAKVGLDGHDRGVKLLARSFRDAGIEVIYTGLWQTPAASVHAAMQEDADIIGVSLHSAAHMTIMPEVLKWQKHYGIEDVPVVLGGIIPQADYPALRDLGVAEVFNPGSSIAEIVAAIRKLAASRKDRDTESLLDAYAKGDVKSLARLITHIQRHGTEALTPQTAHDGGSGARVIGVTGAPGVGKSSFIAKLSGLLRARGQKVAVVAVDPTSPVTGGALLGDRLRMMRAEPDEGFFVRSLSSSNEQGGLGPRVGQVIELLDGFGFDTILLETVGAGQGDTAVLQITKEILLLLMPESGDDIQFSKAGIMEIASAYVLNKCDLPGADATHGNLLNTVGGDRPIWRVSALHDEGLEAVADWVAN
ncbi:MAG: cobalamin B12-binding domain-containing protein [Planctomycetes bacterium]|nr:cobalamin B12-binding domain-containing protein [Planctomycetota bacterium]